jgi:uncharacterized protein YpmB
VKKILANWQLILRIVILLVAIALIFAGFYNLKNYFHDHSAEKKHVSALIVKDPKDPDDQALKYEYAGKVYYGDPVDKILHNYGKLNKELQIYILKDRPQRIFIKSSAQGEATVGSLLLGWGILLAMIVWAERKILAILKRSKKVESD